MQEVIFPKYVERKYKYKTWNDVLDLLTPEELCDGKDPAFNITLNGTKKKFKQWRKNNHVEDVQGCSYQFRIYHYLRDHKNIDFNFEDFTILRKNPIYKRWCFEDKLVLKSEKHTICTYKGENGAVNFYQNKDHQKTNNIFYSETSRVSGFPIEDGKAYIAITTDKSSLSIGFRNVDFMLFEEAVEKYYNIDLLERLANDTQNTS